LGGGRARSILGCERVEQCDAKEGFAFTGNPVAVGWSGTVATSIKTSITESGYGMVRR